MEAWIDDLDLNADVGEGFPYDGRCWRSSPRPTSRAASMPATPRRCGRSAPGRSTRGRGGRSAVVPRPGRLRPATTSRSRREALATPICSSRSRPLHGCRGDGRGRRSRYVKPHGALYNRAVHDDEHAGAVVEACCGGSGCRCWGCRARGCWTWPPSRGGRTFASSSPTAPTTRAAIWWLGAEPGAVLTEMPTVAERIGRLAGSGPCRRATASSRGVGRTASACTATAPVRSRWPRPCGGASRLPASRSGRSHDESDEVQLALPERRDARPCWSRSTTSAAADGRLSSGSWRGPLLTLCRAA